MNKFWEEQMNHKRTKGYYESLKKLITTLSLSGEVLEIGLDVGISARAFLECPDIKLTSVDPGDVEIGIEQITMLAKDRWTFRPMRSDDYFAESKSEFDAVYIDGNHTYEYCLRDIYGAWKLLKPGGYLIGHDIIHKGNFMPDNESDCGVTKAFAQYIYEFDLTATIYPPYPGLIVIKK